MAVKMSELKADPKLLAAALAHGKKSMSIENVLFFHDKGNAQAVYPKYISEKSATQVNLPSAVFNPMKALADKADWKHASWDTLIKTAKLSIEKMWNADVAPRFVTSPEYKAYEIAKAPKKKADPGKAAQLLGIKDVAKLKKALELSIDGNKASAIKLLAEIAKEEKMKDKAEAIMKALEKAGLV